MLGEDPRPSSSSAVGGSVANDVRYEEQVRRLGGPLLGEAQGSEMPTKLPTGLPPWRARGLCGGEATADVAAGMALVLGA